jgi:hypothetical protein
MTRTRTHADDLLGLAVEDLAVALRAAGVGIVRAGKRSLTVTFDDTKFEIDVVPAAYATAPRVEALIDGAETGDRVPVLVADRITVDARERLNQGEWSWLDRRGHLRLRSPGVLIDTDVTPSARSAPSHNEPLRGRAGLSIAYRFLTHPTEAISPTRSGLRFAPSTISEALERIRTAGLIDSDGLPVLPELFWMLAERWNPERTWLATEPDPTDPASSEWCVSGTAAAAALGAPIVSTTSVPDLYVPGPVAVTIAARRFGVARDATVAAASIAVAPVAAVTEVMDDDSRPARGWRLAHPIAVALDLAQDRSRGREVLDDWSPPERVW